MTRNPFRQDLLHKINNDKHCRATVTYLKKTSTSGITEFGIEIFLNYQDPSFTLRGWLWIPRVFPTLTSTTTTNRGD